MRASYSLQLTGTYGIKDDHHKLAVVGVCPETL